MDWKDFFDRLGLNGTRWQWQIIRWQKRWEEFREQWREKKQKVTYPHKFCPECGTLMDRNDKKCPQCGQGAGSWHVQSVGRAVELVVPSSSIATPALIVVNLGFFLILMLRFGSGSIASPPAEALEFMGGLSPARAASGAWWQLITYGYQHGGLIHIAFNLFALSQVGPLLEREIGSARFFSVYTITLVTAVLAYPILFPSAVIVVVGASGALFGLIGFGMSYCHRSGIAMRGYRNFFLKWSIYGFLFGMALPGVANMAHAGGLMGGVILGIFIEWDMRDRTRFRRGWQGGAFACLLLTLAAFTCWLYARVGEVAANPGGF